MAAEVSSRNITIYHRFGGIVNPGGPGCDFYDNKNMGGRAALTREGAAPFAYFSSLLRKSRSGVPGADAPGSVYAKADFTAILSRPSMAWNRGRKGG